MAAAAKKKAAEEKNKKEEKGKNHNKARQVALAAIIIALVILVFFFSILPNSIFNVPFPTFKSNFYSAHRAALLVTFYNQSQSVAESQCYTQLVQSIAHSRNASTIDFYLMNQTYCTYPIGGLGHTLTLANNSTSNCINAASAEPSIFLNYSASNYTIITAYKMYVYGNSAYMASCPIAVDMS